MSAIRFSTRGLDLRPAVALLVVIAGAGLAVVGAGVFVWVLLGLLLVVLLLGLRNGAMRLLIALLPVSILFGPPSNTINASPADFVLIFVTVGALAALHRARLEREDVARLKTVLVYACAVVMLTALSLFYVVEIKPDGPLTTYAILGLFKMCSVMLFLGTFTLYLTVHRDAFVDLLGTWKVVATVIAVVSVLVAMASALGVHTPLTDTMMEAYRLRGTLTDPNAFAAYCILSVALIYAYRAFKGQRAPVLLSAVFLVAILLTGSRAAAPAILLAGLFVALTSAPMRRFLLPVLPSVGLALAVIYAAAAGPEVAAFSRVSEGVEGGGEDDIRFVLWRTAFDLWTNNPIFGVGIGQYQEAGTDLLGYAPGNIPHHTYLSLMSEFGTIGFLVVLSLPAYVGYRLYKMHRAKDLVASCLFIGFLTFAVQAMTLNLENFRPFWAFVAFALVYTTRPRGQGVDPPLPASATSSSASASSMRSAT